MNLDPIIPYLPHFQAILNTLAAILLVMGYYHIRKQQKDSHRRYMIGALGVSAVFMVSYLTYHAHVGYLPFAGQGSIRPVYFTILVSHVVLAAVIVPLVLITVTLAALGKFELHPRFARWTLPLWFYVSVSGVAVYLLAFHFYARQPAV